MFLNYNLLQPRGTDLGTLVVLFHWTQHLLEFCQFIPSVTYIGKQKILKFRFPKVLNKMANYCSKRNDIGEPKAIGKPNRDLPLEYWTLYLKKKINSFIISVLVSCIHHTATEEVDLKLYYEWCNDLLLLAKIWTISDKVFFSLIQCFLC